MNFIAIDLIFGKNVANWMCFHIPYYGFLTLQFEQKNSVSFGGSVFSEHGVCLVITWIFCIAVHINNIVDP